MLAVSHIILCSITTTVFKIHLIAAFSSGNRGSERSFNPMLLHSTCLTPAQMCPLCPRVCHGPTDFALGLKGLGEKPSATLPFAMKG